MWLAYVILKGIESFPYLFIKLKTQKVFYKSEKDMKLTFMFFITSISFFKRYIFQIFLFLFFNSFEHKTVIFSKLNCCEIMHRFWKWQVLFEKNNCFCLVETTIISLSLPITILSFTNSFRNTSYKIAATTNS